MFKLSLIALTLLGAAATGHASSSAQQVVNQISQFGVTYQVNDNQAALHGTDCAALGADYAACNRATITLTNNGPALTDKHWAIYMSNVHQTLRVDNDQFKMTHLVGDLTRLEPTEKFTGIGKGESVQIPIVNEYWQLFATDVMPRWYVTSGQATPKIIASTDHEDPSQFVLPLGDNWRRSADDRNILMQPASRFDKNSDVATLPASALRGQITPTPLAVKLRPQDADLSHGVRLSLTGLTRETGEAVKQRLTLLGLKEDPDGFAIRTQIKPDHFSGKQAKPGAYDLDITPRRAIVVG